MSLLPIRRDPSRADLVGLGLALVAFAALAGATVDWRLGAAIAALAALFAVAPPLRRPIYLGWQYAFYPVGWLVSHAALALVYFLVLTPIGLCLRLAGRDPMQRAFDRRAQSYWRPRDEPPVDRYFHTY